MHETCGYRARRRAAVLAEVDAASAIQEARACKHLSSSRADGELAAGCGQNQPRRHGHAGRVAPELPANRRMQGSRGRRLNRRTAYAESVRPRWRSGLAGQLASLVGGERTSSRGAVRLSGTPRLLRLASSLATVRHPLPSPTRPIAEHLVSEERLVPASDRWSPKRA